MCKRVMIVDDEEIIRKGITGCIDWGRYGLRVVAEAANGEMALEIAKSLKPHIILADIYMPVMDGIEFAKWVKQLLPETVIIFLSGYNEFKYAQKAIEIGVFRYLNKPLREPELVEALEEAKKELEHRELEKSKVDRLKKMIGESLPLLKERFLLNLVGGRLKENEIAGKLNYLNLNMQYSSFICVILSLDDYFALAERLGEDDLNLIKFAVQNISEEIFSELGGGFFMFEEKRNELGVISGFNTGLTEFLYALYPLIQKIQYCVRKYFDTSVSAGIGRCTSSIARVSESYLEAGEALEFKTVYGKESILFIGDMKPQVKHRIKWDTFERVNEIINAVKGGGVEHAARITEQLFNFFIAQNITKKEQIQLMAIQAVIKLEQCVFEYDGTIEEAYGNKFSPFDIINYDTVDAIRDKLSALIEKTASFIGIRRRSAGRNFIRMAKEFIRESYASEDLSLTTVAERVSVSPGYLSQLFKQTEGESCIEYLTKIRITQAKRLLKETTLKTYEIADRVGYGDPQYFSTCFKKMVGVPPTDYRDMISKDIL